jgi:hypothetical protein
MYIPGITGRLVLCTDTSADIFATIQLKAVEAYFSTLVPNAVVVLKNVPVFVRSRFNKQLCVCLDIIEKIFPPSLEDSLSNLNTSFKEENNTISTIPNTKSQLRTVDQNDNFFNSFEEKYSVFIVCVYFYFFY